MQPDPLLPSQPPARLLAISDLPRLDPAPTAEAFIAAIDKSTRAGCNAAVVTISWSALEPRPGRFTLESLKDAVDLQRGRFLFLGIQVVNTTVRAMPADLASQAFDDPEVLTRFRRLLEELAPLLRNRVRYLSIGNETDIYLSGHPTEADAYSTFLDEARRHARSLAPGLTVGTTLTDAGALREEFRDLFAGMDAHFLTYYHGHHGLDGAFKEPETTKRDLLVLAASLDPRPIVFQEIGFPAHESLGSPEKQATFVNGVFDAWDELGDRVQMMNYFMLYDFPEEFVRGLVSYYGVTHETERLANFIGSLGLHGSDGHPRPAWEVFQRRGNALSTASSQRRRSEPTDPPSHPRIPATGARTPFRPR
ncbi:MAG: hypothetical protein KC645_10960 [Gemmatimonadetes bacterium]|nr:hypothetical protein [Gemmatimonadota bacterium]